MNVLAIGLDATEPKLVRKLIEEGEMPALERLLSEGSWMRVESSAGIGSGSVWPSFISGDEASVHGVYGEWLWQPETMSVTRYRGRNLTPFWKKLAVRGMTVGILDVPFMPMIGLSDGFEISEWGAHDLLEGKVQLGPPRVAELLAKKPPHPLTFYPTASGPDDYKELQKLGAACLDGIKLRGSLARDLLTEIRPQLALIAFTEIHHSAHYLWHTIEPDHPVYRSNEFADLGVTRPSMKDIYVELDSQIGELLKTVEKETAVFVFSLHGMQPALGAPSFLAPLLCEMGFAEFANWNNQSWPDRARAFMAAIKRHTPVGLKKLYYRILTPTTTQRLARPTILPTYDWSRTRAFALPTDQHGWIRINLKGREARGIVEPEQYEEICHQLEARLRNLRSENGQPLVREVIRTSERVGDALGRRIPDLVVHWDDAVFTSTRIKGSRVSTEVLGKKFVGQHSLEGFCILKAPLDLNGQQLLSGKDMHRLMERLLTGGGGFKHR